MDTVRIPSCRDATISAACEFATTVGVTPSWPPVPTRSVRGAVPGLLFNPVEGQLQHRFQVGSGGGFDQISIGHLRGGAPNGLFVVARGEKDNGNPIGLLKQPRRLDSIQTAKNVNVHQRQIGEVDFGNRHGLFSAFANPHNFVPQFLHLILQVPRDHRIVFNDQNLLFHLASSPHSMFAQGRAH